MICKEFLTLFLFEKLLFTFYFVSIPNETGNFFQPRLSIFLCLTMKKHFFEIARFARLKEDPLFFMIINFNFPKLRL